MTQEHFYLICFAVGFLFSVLSFLLGGLHWHLPFHLNLGQSDIHFHAGHHSSHHGPHTSISLINPATAAAFLTWFGGAGYLLTRYSSLWVVTGVGVATLFGLIGGGIIFLFLAKVLSSEDENLDPADFEMVGVWGRISTGIREGGTGELIYSQAGTRRTCGARAEDGREIVKGTEVVVTSYEKGIAYVRRWSELIDGERRGMEAAGISVRDQS